MNTKHTPGPWIIQDDGDLRYLVTDSRTESNIIAGPWAFSLPVVKGDDGSERLANARLIAAAPELLAALEACLLREDIADDELGDMIRAAIAKAKGE